MPQWSQLWTAERFTKMFLEFPCHALLRNISVNPKWSAGHPEASQNGAKIVPEAI
jgi:hypothetical protein